MQKSFFLQIGRTFFPVAEISCPENPLPGPSKTVGTRERQLAVTMKAVKLNRKKLYFRAYFCLWVNFFDVSCVVKTVRFFYLNLTGEAVLN
jgi:hypothetical protein